MILQDIFDHSILGSQSLIEWFQLLTNGQWIALGLIIFTFIIFKMNYVIESMFDLDYIDDSQMIQYNFIPDLVIKLVWVIIVYVFSYQLWIALTIILVIMIAIIYNMKRLETVLKKFQIKK